MKPRVSAARFGRDLEESRGHLALVQRLSLGRRRGAWMLFASELALAGYSLVRFGDVLDPVLKLAASFGQLLGYHVADTGRSPSREIRGQRDSLAGSKLVFCHSAAFPAHVVVLARQGGLVPIADESITPEKPSRSASRSRCGDGFRARWIFRQDSDARSTVAYTARMLATF